MSYLPHSTSNDNYALHYSHFEEGHNLSLISVPVIDSRNQSCTELKVSYNKTHGWLLLSTNPLDTLFTCLSE